MKTNFLMVADRLGGELVKLVPKRAKAAGTPSPGMVMTLDFDGEHLDLDEWFVQRIQIALEDGDG